MVNKSRFRQELEEAVGERHLVNHPLYKNWREGELSRQGMMGMMLESWFWISRLVPKGNFLIASKAPQDVIDMELENVGEELDPKNPHPALFLRFIKACGFDPDALTEGRGLPSTEWWCNWQLAVAEHEPWQAGVAAMHVGSEFQAAGTMTSVLAALREEYKFSEHDIEHFWIHGEADVRHSASAFEVLERHCTTRELKDLAARHVRDSARFKWFFTDCIYLHYEKGELN